jgi:hypothetical protein
VNEPRRLRDGQNALVTELLDAGRGEEPSPELITRALRSAAFGVGAGLTVIQTAAASTLGTGGVSAGSVSAASTGGAAMGGTASGAASLGAASAGAGLASASVAGGAAANLTAGAALAKSGFAGVALAKWVGVGVLGLSVATGAPKVLHWAEQQPSSDSGAPAARALGPSVPERRAPSASRAEPPSSRREPPVMPEPVAAPPAPGLEPLGASKAVAAPSTQRAATPVLRVVSPTQRRAERAPTLAAPMPSRSGAARVDTHTLGFELREIDRARVALQRGDAAQALRELERYELDAPEQQLRLEVAMLRMDAHAALGDMTRARSLASEIVAQPVSPLHAARAREILNGSGARH